MKDLLKENNQQKHQFRSYYCLDCKQVKSCGILSKEYCCACAYQIEREKAGGYSNYQQVYQLKVREKKEHEKQLLLLKNYWGCKVCGSKLVVKLKVLEIDRGSIWGKYKLWNHIKISRN